MKEKTLKLVYSSVQITLCVVFGYVLSCEWVCVCVSVYDLRMCVKMWRRRSCMMLFESSFVDWWKNISRERLIFIQYFKRFQRFHLIISKNFTENLNLTSISTLFQTFFQQFSKFQRLKLWVPLIFKLNLKCIQQLSKFQWISSSFSFEIYLKFKLS